MRRIWASLLLAISALSLIGSAVSAVEAESKLPACCRRNGHHHCAIRDRQTSDGGIRLQAGRCSLFPTRDGMPARGESLVAPSGTAMVVAAMPLLQRFARGPRRCTVSPTAGPG